MSSSEIRVLLLALRIRISGAILSLQTLTLEGEGQSMEIERLEFQKACRFGPSSLALQLQFRFFICFQICLVQKSLILALKQFVIDTFSAYCQNPVFLESF